MDEDFPISYGVHRVMNDWSVRLPLPMKRRVDDGDLVFWRPGLTMWLSAWGADDGLSVDELIKEIRADADPAATGFTQRDDGDVCRFSYRLDGNEGGDPALGIYAFAFHPSGHLHAAIYFDAEADLDLAEQLAEGLLYGQVADAEALPALLEPAGDAGATRELVPGMGACIASKRVADEGQGVGLMYREEPDHENDSGWRFLAGSEDEAYSGNADNFALYEVNTIATLDRSVIRFLGYPAGSAFERQEDGAFVAAELEAEVD